MRLYRCRSCRHENDFDTVERELNEKLSAAGEVLMLTNYECERCGFSLRIDPFWFVTDPADTPMFIETGFEVIAA